MDVIKDTEGSANTGRAISIYNAKVIGIHQYFQLATMISEDVSKYRMKFNTNVNLAN